MTKYEWESELSKNLKKVPKEEAQRILDYYNELFLDKADAGHSEKEIIKSFGNPFDVAYRVVYEFEGTSSSISNNNNEATIDAPKRAGYEDANNNQIAIEQEKTFGVPAREVVNNNIDNRPYQTQAQPQSSQNNASNYTHYNAPAPKRKKSTGGIIARIIFFVPFFVVFTVLWSLAISFIASGIGSAIGGLGMAILALFYLGDYAAAAAATIGMGLVASGIGLLMLIFTRPIVKGAVRLTQKYFYIGKHKTAKREVE